MVGRAKVDCGAKLPENSCVLNAARCALVARVMPNYRPWGGMHYMLEAEAWASGRTKTPAVCENANGAV